MTAVGQAAPAAMFEGSADGLAWRAVEGRDSDILVVVFSQVRVPAGHFGLSRLFARTRHPALFVNQPDNGWYRGTDAALDGAITAAAAAVRPLRLVFYGSSMGAFGAVAAAGRHDRAEVIAFAPDHRIGEPGSRSAAAGLALEPGEPTLLDHLRRPRSGPTTIVTGLFDPYDAGVAARIGMTDLPETMRLVTLASSHEVHDHLYSVNVIRRVIATFDRDVAIEAASRGLLIAAPDFARAAAFADLAACFEAGESVDPSAVRALGAEDDPGVALLLAAVLDRAGDLAAAEAVLSATEERIAASPALMSLTKRYRKRIPRRRIDLLTRMDLPQEAEAVRRAAAIAFPADPAFAG